MPELRPPLRAPRVGLVWAGVVGAGLGLMLALVALGMTRTSVERATELTAAIAPASSNATAVSELDPPFWYQGRFRLQQTFSGGAPEREALTTALRGRLIAAGWTLLALDEAPGGTVIEARYDDLYAHVTAFGPSSTADVRGVIYVWWLDRWPSWIVLAGGVLLGAGVAIGWITLKP